MRKPPVLVFAAIVLWIALAVSALGANTSPVRAVGPLCKPMDVSVHAVPRPKSRVLAGQGEVREWIRLEAPKESEYLAADEEGLKKGVRTIGMVRDLQQPYRVGASKKAIRVSTIDGVKIWAIVIESPTATGIRLGLDDVALPDGATLRVASMIDPAHVVGPYGPATMIPGERFWTETVFDQAVVLECQMPVAADETAFALSISKMAHLYAPFEYLHAPKEGSCHNDITCSDSQWRATGNSVAGIGTIGDSGVLWCTGTLLNNTEQDFTDYFLTANHCVANQAEASSTEYYWFYQTSTCNGAPPHPASVPRTGQGADYLQGRTRSQANDYALLRLRQASPGGVIYAGWTSSHPGSSAAIKGIHHPDGSHKRMSHGTLISETANFWSVRWSSGVTEPGSSGSPLFNSSGEVIGQLYGGYSSCSWPSGIDEYGRFDVAYPLISQWLAPETSSLGNALDAPALTWTTGGHANWFASSRALWNAAGPNHAHSGAITHNQQSWLQTTVTGPGTISFWWFVSSEETYDFLRFFVGGAEKARISGDFDLFRQLSVPIPAGQQVLKWQYDKDGSVEENLDCGWVDAVVWTPGGGWDTGYQALGSGWRRLTWFGDYIPMGSDGWIWHNKHGFFFVAASSTPQSIWFYAQDMGWLWTSSSGYPFLYRSRDQVWLWYNGARNPRWFRNMTTGQWERWP